MQLRQRAVEKKRKHDCILMNFKTGKTASARAVLLLGGLPQAFKAFETFELDRLIRQQVCCLSFGREASLELLTLSLNF